MLLYVMRHGPAQDRAPSGFDADRTLTADGRDLAVKAANELARQSGGGIARVVSSPLLRARETAEIARSIVCPQGSIDIRRELLPNDAPPINLVREVLALGGDSLLVGHLPSVEHLVQLLLDDPGRAALAVGFRTAVIVCLEAVLSAPNVPLAIGRWRLRVVIDPRRLTPVPSSG